MGISGAQVSPRKLAAHASNESVEDLLHPSRLFSCCLEFFFQFSVVFVQVPLQKYAEASIRLYQSSGHSGLVKFRFFKRHQRGQCTTSRKSCLNSRLRYIVLCGSDVVFIIHFELHPIMQNAQAMIFFELAWLISMDKLDKW